MSGLSSRTHENSAFSIWYSKQKGGFEVTRDPAISGADATS